MVRALATNARTGQEKSAPTTAFDDSLLVDIRILTARGLSNPEIAQQLRISDSTLYRYLKGSNR